MPGMLSTLYRCLQCHRNYKRSEKDQHLEEFPDHEVYKSVMDQDWNAIKPSEREVLEQENQELWQEMEREYQKLEKLAKAIQAFKEALP